jgi:hypothetical protein
MSTSGRPRVVFFGPPGAGKTTLAGVFRGAGVETVDDGQASETADALIVCLDASAPENEADRTFADVRTFLDTFETDRTYGRAVADLPVFLTLTKCDKLPGPAEVAARAARLRTRFDEFLSDGPDGFGSLDVSVATTGGLQPNAPVRADVTGLVRDATKAATDYRNRSARSGRRVTATVSAAGSAVALLAAAAGAFFAVDPYGPDDPLVARVRAFQAAEGPPAVRLSDAILTRTRTELNGIRGSSGFDRLPTELKDFVAARLAEVDAYSAYRDQFRPPRLGPADVRTLAELDRLDGDLRSVLAPPAEYASTWAETDAVKLRDKWAADATAARAAEARIHDWYRGLVRRANGLLLADPFEPAWKADGDALLRDAAKPPAKPTDPLPGSPGEPLTYAVPLDFTRVDFDKRDWEAVRNRLTNLRAADAALSGGVLDVPFPSGDSQESLRLGSTLLKALPADTSEWSANRFPEPARTKLQQRYLLRCARGTLHVWKIIQTQFPKDRPDTPADWKTVAEFVHTNSGMKDWMRLLERITTLADAEPPADLAAFLTRTSFELSLTSIEVEIPVDLSTQKLIPGSIFTLRLTGSRGTPMDYKLKRVGEPNRRDEKIISKYIPDGWDGKLTLVPGDSLTASLPVSIDGPEVRLVWDSNRTRTFAFESLSRDAALVPAAGPRSPATGVRVTVTPPNGLPVVPILIPDLSPRTR